MLRFPGGDSRMMMTQHPQQYDKENMGNVWAGAIPAKPMFAAGLGHQPRFAPKADAASQPRRSPDSVGSAPPQSSLHSSYSSVGSRQGTVQLFKDSETAKKQTPAGSNRKPLSILPAKSSYDASLASAQVKLARSEKEDRVALLEQEIKQLQGLLNATKKENYRLTKLLEDAGLKKRQASAEVLEKRNAELSQALHAEKQRSAALAAQLTLAKVSSKDKHRAATPQRSPSPPSARPPAPVFVPVSAEALLKAASARAEQAKSAPPARPPAATSTTSGPKAVSGDIHSSQRAVPQGDAAAPSSDWEVQAVAQRTLVVGRDATKPSSAVSLRPPAAEEAAAASDRPLYSSAIPCQSINLHASAPVREPASDSVSSILRLDDILANMASVGGGEQEAEQREEAPTSAAQADSGCSNLRASWSEGMSLHHQANDALSRYMRAWYPSRSQSSDKSAPNAEEIKAFFTQPLARLHPSSGNEQKDDLLDLTASQREVDLTASGRPLRKPVVLSAVRVISGFNV